MSKKDTRANIKISEALADEFRTYADITGMTHEELLRTLLSQKVTSTTTVVIEPKMANRIEKEGD